MKSEPKSCSRPSLNDRQRLAWLRLIRSENVGPVTFRELINRFGSAEAAIEMVPELSSRGGSKRRITLFSVENAEKELDAAERCGAKLVAVGEFGYPARLQMTDAPPPLLYIMGRPELAQQALVAVVGSRNGSAVGQKFAQTLSSELGQAGFGIISGLARGIDRAAHVASIKSGTIAVVAGGIDCIYPPENAEIQKTISKAGLLVSERPPGLRPRAQDFPRRNNIIAGSALGVVVVEAAQRSGSLITARCAVEHNREVFAVPGNPLDPRAYGTNKLIKDGATLITGVEDVVSVLAPIMGRIDELSVGEFQEGARDLCSSPATTRQSRNQVASLLGSSPIDVDELIRMSGLSAQEVRIVLLELELAGRIERHGRQLVSLI